MGAPHHSSFTQRRPHAAHLGNFELPPPASHRYPFVTASQSSQAPTTVASVGNLLTPPNSLNSSGVSTSGPHPTTMAYSNGSYIYPHVTQAQAHYGYTSTQQQQNQYSQARGGTFAQVRNDRQYEHQDSLRKGLNQQLPPFTPSSNASSMPSMSAQQQPHHMMNTHAQTPVSSSAPQQSPALAQDSFRQPHPPTPTYNNYQSAGTPQHSNFPYSTGPSPTMSQQQSPISAGGSMSRMSPAVSQGPIPSIPSNNQQHSPYPYQRPPPSGYQPGSAPVFSNVQNPNGQLSLVGVHPQMMPGFNSGHAAQMPHFMGHPPHQQQAANDRPFKCDQCPQSFNRNHDLKRHKRIHLAVKPFPCNHCDKSFSRKDALKVSLLSVHLFQSQC